MFWPWNQLWNWWIRHRTRDTHYVYGDSQVHQHNESEAAKQRLIREARRDQR